MKKLFFTFRREPVYRDMMEHDPFLHGAVCFYQSQTMFVVKDKDVEEYCDLNDRYGRPIRFQYSPTLSCSPTSLRYIFHSLLILNRLHMLNIKEVSIHGFLAWNMIDLYNFGKVITFTNEIPQTGYTNKFVFF